MTMTAASRRFSRTRCSALALLTVLCCAPLAHAQPKAPKDKAAADKSAAADKAAADKAAADKAAADKAAADKAAADKAGEDTAAAGDAETTEGKPEPPSAETVQRAGSHFE